jgi:hypothetical protein
MSFDIFIQRFVGGEAERLPPEALQRAFGPSIEARDPDEFRVIYADGGVAAIYVGGDRKTHGMTINRPPNSPAFWDSIVAYLRETQSVLYWPGEPPSAAVATTDVIAHLPPGFVEGLGTPQLVRSGDDIIKLIEQS